jgi:hypothetical protein
MFGPAHIGLTKDLFLMTQPNDNSIRDAIMIKEDGFAGVDATNPKSPSGHAYGIRTSTRLTSYYRQTHRRNAVDVTPQEVIDCIVAANVTNWVLMGLHGYVGYMPMPRATQDVDIMVPYSQKDKAAKAIAERWPMLEKRSLSQVVRFMDPGDPDEAGNPKPVIDIMLPCSEFQKTILLDHVLIDPESGNRIPTVEAAIVSKYAAVVSPHRDWMDKQQDSIDMRRIMKANSTRLDRDRLSSLAAQVWEGGGLEIVKYLELALADKPFS